MEYAGDAARKFFEWIRYADTGDDSERRHLEDYLYKWLVDGDAVENVGGKYEHWLTAAVHIADAVFRDPSLLQYAGDEPAWSEAEQYRARHGEWPTSTIRQRPIEGILDPDGSSLAPDRHHFDVVVWQRNHPVAPTPDAR